MNHVMSGPLFSEVAYRVQNDLAQNFVRHINIICDNFDNKIRTNNN